MPMLVFILTCDPSGQDHEIYVESRVQVSLKLQSQILYRHMHITVQHSYYNNNITHARLERQ